ncbi:Serine-threonine/tyrosine-protein kinase, catalytic domain [Sesbania bispinosa]|nr:Serine-threonine/tyrosine-protein kinase, catalytic domain [Sesbania bispinosa]
MLPITLLLLCFPIELLISRTQAEPTYSYHFCLNTTTFAPNSIYQTNLKTLLSTLSSNSNQSDGFYNTTTGQNNPNNTLYGLFLCRGDVTTQTCQDCVSTATKQVLQRCPNEKEAFIWYDECLLQYSDESFFSTVQERPLIPLSNSANASDQSSFMQLVGVTLRAVADEAENGENGKKFATKEANFTGSTILYTLGQCTPDLSTPDCNKCLQIAIANLPNCCNGKLGGRVLTPSCYVRYEVYPFYRSVALAPVPRPDLPQEGRSKTSTGTIIAIIVTTVLFIVVVFLCCWYLTRGARKKYTSFPEQNVEISTAESLQFDLDTIKSATDNFSRVNKLGQGGFGEVYKGTLPSGLDIAVKRLSRSSRQGVEQFKNEVVTMAQLQHRNLVRLLGFCLDEEEKILIYEYVPNKSLNHFLFDPQLGNTLDWSKRYMIIGGIARGILYLHEDSRLRIIHRDLKASNILLDEELNPKISDFGTAKIFGGDLTQANTNRIVGTFGYMSPEYAMHGQFSVKSDVYSFGVMVLEIISGRKNKSDLLSYAWKLWREGAQLELLDPALKDSYSREEVIRTLLSSLSSNVTGNTAFYNTTVSGGSSSDTVYGLFMCRGDVPRELCQKCVANATQRLHGQGSDTCPFAKGAIIWYDECMVRYSNRYFFSTVDTRPRMRLRNTANVSDPESFVRLLYTTLNESADEAANSSNGARFATKEAKISGFQTLYCLTQCTPDLSPQDCRRCLSGVIGDLAWCCHGNQGGRVLYPSCNFRYELYPFYRMASPTPEGLVSPTNSAIQKGKKGILSETATATFISVTVAVLSWAFVS